MEQGEQPWPTKLYEARDWRAVVHKTLKWKTALKMWGLYQIYWRTHHKYGRREGLARKRLGYARKPRPRCPECPGWRTESLSPWALGPARSGMWRGRLPRCHDCRGIGPGPWIAPQRQTTPKYEHVNKKKCHPFQQLSPIAAIVGVSLKTCGVFFLRCAPHWEGKLTVDEYGTEVTKHGDGKKRSRRSGTVPFWVWSMYIWSFISLRQERQNFKKKNTTHTRTHILTQVQGWKRRRKILQHENITVNKWWNVLCTEQTEKKWEQIQRSKTKKRGVKSRTDYSKYVEGDWEANMIRSTLRVWSSCASC